MEIFGSNVWPSSNAELQSFHDELRSISQIDQSPNFIPTLIRGTSTNLSPYLTTSDDRVVEYGIKEMLFDHKSTYQRVQIVKTIDHGNVLVLDGAVNLAENDTVPYTHSLMNLPHVREITYKYVYIMMYVQRYIFLA